jgi:undecaprenyl-diphosphatase
MPEWIHSADRALFLLINHAHSPLADRVMWTVSQTWPVVVVLLSLGYGRFRKFGLRKAAEFLIGCALVVAVTDFSANLIKHGVKRPRPTHNTELVQHVHTVNDYKGGAYGFFSSHAANTMAVVVVALLLLKEIDWRYRVWLLALPLVVAYSRVYLGVHYPSDIAAGLLYGCVTGYFGFRLLTLYFFKPDAPID